MNFLKRRFFLFCNDLIFFFFFSILFYLIGCLSVQVEPVLKRPIWEATSIPHSTFFVQKCPNVRHSFRYVWIFFSFIHNVQGRHFLVLLSFFLLQKFKMLTTTMLWPQILQITTRRLCRAISRKKYVIIIMVHSFYFQGPVFCPDPESDSLSHQQYDLVGLSTGATNWCNVGAFTRIAQ